MDSSEWRGPPGTPYQPGRSVMPNRGAAVLHPSDVLRCWRLHSFAGLPGIAFHDESFKALLIT
jgi:hypothetical protein